MIRAVGIFVMLLVSFDEALVMEGRSPPGVR